MTSLKRSRNLRSDQSIEKRSVEEKIDLLEEHYKSILSILKQDWENDPNLAETPRRIAKSIYELTNADEAMLNLKSFPAESYDQIISVCNLKFHTICAHHFLPFFGNVHIAYIPGKKIFGLSKFARIVKFFSKRPQVQENFTEQIADFIDRSLKPKGVMVYAEARHLCMEMRGIERGGDTKTSCIRGVFRKDAAAKAEAIRIFGL